MWGAIVVALLVGVYIGYATEKQRATSNLEATKMIMQKEIDDAKMMANNAPAVSTQDAAMKKNQDIMMMAQQDTTSKKGDLKDVSGGTASGKAFVLRKEGKLYFTASADLPDPANGSFYEGWLVKKGSSPVRLTDTGKFDKQSDGSYEDSYSSENLYDGYDFVVVTWEQGQVNPQNPGKHILEGMVQ